jgi:hypothetical protein
MLAAGAGVSALGVPGFVVGVSVVGVSVVGVSVVGVSVVGYRNTICESVSERRRCRLIVPQRTSQIALRQPSAAIPTGRASL